MSEEAQATQDNTSAVQASEAQAPAPSLGEQVLRPASAIAAEQESTLAQAATINAAQAVDVEARAQLPTDAPAQPTEATEAKEQDLGLLEKAKPEESEGAPEAYEAFTFPEGIDVDEGDVSALQSIAKEMGLPQSAAQAGAEMTARALSAMVANAQAESDAWKAEQVKEWNAQPQSAERTLLAKKALEHAGLLDYAVESGYMHDAKLLAAFSAFGALVSEAKVIVGSEGAPGGAAPSPYTNSPEFN